MTDYGVLSRDVMSCIVQWTPELNWYRMNQAFYSLATQVIHPRPQRIVTITHHKDTLHCFPRLWNYPGVKTKLNVHHFMTILMNLYYNARRYDWIIMMLKDPEVLLEDRLLATMVNNLRNQHRHEDKELLQFMLDQDRYTYFHTPSTLLYLEFGVQGGLVDVLMTHARVQNNIEFWMAFYDKMPQFRHNGVTMYELLKYRPKHLLIPKEIVQRYIYNNAVHLGHHDIDMLLALADGPVFTPDFIETLLERKTDLVIVLVQAKRTYHLAVAERLVALMLEDNAGGYVSQLCSVAKTLRNFSDDPEVHRLLDNIPSST
jgi:hypothetical protein